MDVLRGQGPEFSGYLGGWVETGIHFSVIFVFIKATPKCPPVMQVTASLAVEWFASTKDFEPYLSLGKTYPGGVKEKTTMVVTFEFNCCQ